MTNSNDALRGTCDALLSEDTIPVHCHDDRDSHWVGASGQAHYGSGSLEAASADMDPVVSECSEYAEVRRSRGISRRTVLAGAGLGAFLMTSPLSRFAYSTAHAATPNSHTIVAIFFRGGMDGLGVVAPLGDANYTRMRPNLGLNDSTLLPLVGGKFGIHPGMPKMQALINAGDATVVHATGHPDKSRSHFEKQKFHETGAMQATMRSGWLGRYLASSGDLPTFRALTMGASSAFMLANPTGPTLAMSALGDFSLKTADGLSMAAISSKIQSLWSATGSTGQAAMETTMRAALDAQRYAAMPQGAGYPGGLGARLAGVAKLIKAGAGLEVACVDDDGWDMHGDMGQATGTGYSQLRSKVQGVDDALAAFWNDLGPDFQSRVTVVTMSEFGRTGYTNGGNGTDHGYGNLMFVLSKGVGGGVKGTWPGLDPSALDSNDLNIVNDYRNVVAELMTKKMGVTSTQLAGILPDFTPSSLGIWTA